MHVQHLLASLPRRAHEDTRKGPFIFVRGWSFLRLVIVHEITFSVFGPSSWKIDVQNRKVRSSEKTRSAAGVEALWPLFLENCVFTFEF